jgi:hypothetical protein
VHEDVHELDRDGHGVGATFVADVDRFLNSRSTKVDCSIAAAAMHGQSLASADPDVCMHRVRKK